MVDFTEEYWDKMLEEAEKEQEEVSRNFEESALYRLREEGIYYMRFLPPKSDIDPKLEMWRPIGFHYQIFHGNDAPRGLPCPHFTHGESCRIDEAINELIATKAVDRNDMFGFGGMGVQKSYLHRVLIIGFSPKKKGVKLDLEFPVIKVVPFKATIKNRVISFMKVADEEPIPGIEVNLDPVEARKQVYDLTVGRPVKVTKDSALDKYWSADLVDKVWAIPKEFSDESQWPTIESCVPNFHEHDLDRMLLKHKLDADELLVPFIDRIGSIEDVPDPALEFPPPEEPQPPTHSYEEAQAMADAIVHDTDDLQAQLDAL